MIPFLNQLATSWQTRGNFPLVSGLCARLCHVGVVLLDTFDSSVLQAEAVIANRVGVQKDCSVGGEASCGFPIQNAGGKQGCTRIASIAHRLLQLCDQFELEFEGRGLPTDAAEGDHMEDLHMSMLFVSEYLREWCEEVARVDVSSSTKIVVPRPEGGKREVEVGTMYCIKYPLEGSDGFIPVATTRPETMFADVAIAVHPDDDRYSQLVGKVVRHPLCSDRKIPVIADRSVKLDKGTGALKITPLHDALDWEIASRHREEILSYDRSAFAKNCVDVHGRLNQEAREFAGIDRFDARLKVIEKLDSSGLLQGTLKHDGQISLCSRTGDVIEPRLTDQWFMDTEELYDDAAQAIRQGRIRILPTMHEQKLFDWLSNKDPWCLSRQLLWGHRIPAYRAGNSSWVIARSLNDARRHFGEDAIVVQDDDVLDTWFSSSLIPLVNAGWPSPKFDPSSPLLDVMETGWDILGFWVARMIIVTMRLSGGQVPFSNVLLHGLVRDSSGKKMSKSLGNVIDPLDVVDGVSREKMIERIEQSYLSKEEIATATSAIASRFPDGIARAGPDALRFALLRHDLFASDIPLNITELSSEGHRFCNKLWNMVAYVETVTDNSPTMKDVDSEHPADEWILSRLAGTLEQVDEHMSGYMPHHAFTELQNFILGSLCDVYLETTKHALWEKNLPRIAEIRTTLNRVVQPTLVQLSVFMPFVAEYLYERVFRRESGSIYFDFVKASFFRLQRSEELESDMKILLRIVSTVRSIRRQLELPSSMVFSGSLHCDAASSDFSRLSPILFDLAKFDLLDISSNDHEVLPGFAVCPLPGRDGRLSLKIEDTHRPDFVLRLQRLLKKYEERSDLFRRKAEKYEAIVLRDRQEGKVKPHIIEKNEKKARQARGTSDNASAEVERIRILLEEMSA
ncbi:Valyl Amino-acyl tRNA Synthetase [Trichostrongylus colubriformis]|uniref:valine--tRNA ligase n=1 Tax=Trichostrongylus colubriformis TaxID=6319 RepID=A0AAN8INW1_TRICO